MAEETQAVVIGGDAGFLWIKPQTVYDEQLFDARKTRVGGGTILGQQQKIVSVAHDAQIVARQRFVDYVEIEIGKQRRERRALRDATSAFGRLFQP